MTTASPAPATVDPTSNKNTESKEDRLREFLFEKAAGGDVYFKGKFIADEVDLSPKEIGALMVKLRESATELIIEKWSYTSATTWRVRRA